LITLITKQLPQAPEIDVKHEQKEHNTRRNELVPNKISNPFSEAYAAKSVGPNNGSQSDEMQTLSSSGVQTSILNGRPAGLAKPLQDSEKKNHSKPLQRLVSRGGWQPMLMQASEPSEMKLFRQPRGLLRTSASLHRFNKKLSTFSRAELLGLLKILQERIDHSGLMVKKRQVATDMRETLDPDASVARFNTSTAVVSPPSLAPTTSNTTPRSTEIVKRSNKMNHLMNYLDSIESMVSKIDVGNLDRLSTMDGERSIVHVVRPELMSTILVTDGNAGSNPSQFLGGKDGVRGSQGLEEDERVVASWKPGSGIGVESVAPDAGWPQEEVEEDWPSQTTAKPKKRKRKRKRIPTTTTTSTTSTSTTTTTTSTTTSTTTTPAPESWPTTSQPPSSGLEEIWIEEEEDIVRPPKRKTKKYKKKTLPTSDTTTTTSTTTTTRAPTTSTSTTTTQVPTTSTTTTQAPIEDWPEEEAWPEQQPVIISSTKAPKLWPSQPVPGQQQQQQQQQQQDEKWPEEEWLNELRDEIQNRLHVIYV